MAELTFKARGKRWPALARRVAAENPGAKLIESADALVVRGPTITLTRRMVLDTCFPDGTENPGTATRLLTGLALGRKGRLVARTADRIVIGDDDGERAVALGLRPDHLAAIERLSGELGMSRNAFLVAALEHYVGYLEEARRLPDLDGEPDSPIP